MIKPEANFGLVGLDYDDGVSRAIEAMRSMLQVSAFGPDWEVNGILLSRDEDAFRAELRKEVTADDLAFGTFGLGAESARSHAGRDVEIEQFLLTYHFSREAEAPQFAQMRLKARLGTLDTMRGLVRVFHDWLPLQHLSAGDRWYKREASPLGERRKGIGWLGWVPFDLMDDEVTEAAVVEPLGRGTFLASQVDYWEVTDREAVARARALELKLNALGVLPTVQDLARGDWGRGG